MACSTILGAPKRPRPITTPRKRMRWRLVAKIEPLQLSQEGRRLVNQHAASFRQIASLCDAGSLPEATASYKEHGALAGAAMEQTASELMAQEIGIMRASAEAGRAQVRFAEISITAISTVGIATLVVTLFRSPVLREACPGCRLNWAREHWKCGARRRRSPPPARSWRRRLPAGRLRLKRPPRRLRKLLPWLAKARTSQDRGRPHGRRGCARGRGQ
jgi:hypothetical protein